MNDPYQSHFGAEPPTAMDAGAQLANTWTMAKLLVPQSVKEIAVIAFGVFGGLALFRMFGKKVPAGTAGS